MFNSRFGPSAVVGVPAAIEVAAIARIGSHRIDTPGPAGLVAADVVRHREQAGAGRVVGAAQPVRGGVVLMPQRAAALIEPGDVVLHVLGEHRIAALRAACDDRRDPRSRTCLPASPAPRREDRSLATAFRRPRANRVERYNCRQHEAPRN